MAEPDTILIPHEDFDGARFTHVGRYAGDNQFLACITYASQYVAKFYWTEEITVDGQLCFRQCANCFAALHRFDSAGCHLGTAVERLGGTDDSDQDDWAKLDKMVANLGDIQRCDIHVKPFRIEIDKIVFGLIYERAELDGSIDPDESQEYVMLEPNDIMFHPPWEAASIRPKAIIR